MRTTTEETAGEGGSRRMGESSPRDPFGLAG